MCNVPFLIYTASQYNFIIETKSISQVLGKKCNNFKRFIYHESALKMFSIFKSSMWSHFYFEWYNIWGNDQRHLIDKKLSIFITTRKKWNSFVLEIFYYKFWNLRTNNICDHKYLVFSLTTEHFLNLVNTGINETNWLMLWWRNTHMHTCITKYYG